jgi:CHAT domain-containing protein/tetratricopeptide (TPR) repeat protein
MDASYVTRRTIACGHCGRHFEVPVHLIIDAEHRPDLLALIRERRLDAVRCPHCGGEGWVDEPMLIWRPASVPPILFATATDRTMEEAEQDAADFTTMLKHRLEPGQQPSRWYPVMAPPALLHEVVSRDLLEDIRRLAAGERIELDDERYRDFLGYVERYLQAVALDTALERFTDACTWDDAAAVLRGHPEFLTSAGEQNLAGEIQAAQARGDLPGAALHKEHLDALRLFRREGTDRPPAGKDGSDPLGPQSELRVLVREIDVMRDDPDRDRLRWLWLHERALKLTDRARDPQVWALLRAGLASARLADWLLDGGERLELAIADYEAALAAWDPAERNQEWADAQINLGIAYSQRMREPRARNIERAIACYEAASAVFDRASQPADWARLRYNLAVAYRRRLAGDRTENSEIALRNYKLALEAYAEQGLTVEHGTALASVGALYVDRIQGDRQDNLRLAIQALNAALKELPLQERLSRAIARHNLGHAYHLRSGSGGDDADAEGDLDRALECYEAAMYAYRKMGMPVKAAQVWCSIGGAYRNRSRGGRADNIERAMAAYRSALELLTAENMPSDWAMAQYGLGLAYREREQGAAQENLAQATFCMQAALTVFTPETSPADCGKVARTLGRTWASAQEWPRAITAYRIALDAADRLYQASLLRSGRESELATTGGLYGQAAYALARNGDLEAAVETLEHGRARGIGDVLARDRAELEQVMLLDPDAYQAYCSAAQRVTAVELDEWSLAGVDAGGLAGVNAGGLAELRGRAREARRSLARSVERIRELPGHGAFVQPGGFAETARAVRRSASLAYLTTQSQGSVILLVHQGPGDDVAVERIRVDTLTASELQGMLLGDGKPAGGYLPAQLGQTADLAGALTVILPALGRSLVAPLAERLRARRANAVCLVPCGLLSLLPLHAATYPGPDGEGCLLDEFDVTYTPSARVLAAVQEALKRRGDGRHVLAAVGNPAPDGRPLVFAEAEVNEVASYFEQAFPFVGADATKQALLDASAHATHVHLACHGRFDTADPLKSRLELAGDGRLGLREMLSLRPFAAARLVVASACQTAITEFARVPDETIGFPGAILEAGGLGVVGTLWAVNDLSTALVVTRFYEYHLRGRAGQATGGMEPARALRLAQCWLRDLTGRQLISYAGQHPRLARAAERVLPFADAYPSMRPFAGPYHWAPYVMVGV